MFMIFGQMIISEDDIQEEKILAAARKKSRTTATSSVGSFDYDFKLVGYESGLAHLESFNGLKKILLNSSYSYNDVKSIYTKVLLDVMDEVRGDNFIKRFLHPDEKNKKSKQTV